MTAQSTATAAAYHRATSYQRHRLTPHALDWGNQPALIKKYPGLPRTPLPGDHQLPGIDYFKLLVRPLGRAVSSSAALDGKQISTALHLTHAVTARSMHAGQPFYFRSAASAGALYPFELYLAAHRIDGIDPGLYHFDPLTVSLTALRRGQVPIVPPVDAGVTATFFISGIFFRSAWKYRSRAYRYVLLDAGHLLENLRLALSALNRTFAIHLDFDDDRAAMLLGLDPEREVCLAAVHLYCGSGTDVPEDAAERLTSLGADILHSSQVAGRETVYPEILDIHRAGNGDGRRRVAALPALAVTDRQPADWIDLNAVAKTIAADYASVLRQRRSRRNFIPAAVSREVFMTFLQAVAASLGSGAGVPAAYRSALTAGLLAGENQPVPPGFYLLDPEKRRLGTISRGPLIEAMASACLNQMWLKHAGMHLLLLTDPAALDRVWGARGYRYAMLEAGRLGQQAYLAATALGWGACGIGAIYDREAANIIGLTDDGALLYLIGLGPVKTR